MIDRSRWFGTALTAAALAALALGAAGCGGSSGVAKASATPAAGPGKGGTDAARLVRFAQCMRSHGVPQFPDPVGGRLNLRVTKGGPLDPQSPQFQAAQQACKSLEPPDLQSGRVNPQQQSQMLKFVACMRSHGVPDFPDPQGGRLLIGGGKVDPNSPQFKSAMQACRKLLPGGAPGGQ